MKVQVLSLDKDKIRFIVENVDVAFANALRRTMIAEVPCMAIDDIFIFDNSSVIVDEALAHRIGLVPLNTDLERYSLPEDCECGSELGCDKCRVILTLDAETDNETTTIYSGDFVSDDPSITPVNPEIPLTKIAPDQAVRLEAYARLGKGKTHAKWQPVSEAIYQNIAEIEVDKKKCDDCAECVKACPRDVFTIEGGKLKVVDVNSCIICKECEKACPEPGAISVGYKPNAFLFSVETTGCLPPEKIVAQAGKILITKLDEFSGKIEKGETDEEITEFEAAVQEGRRLYSIGVGDYEEEDEEEENYDEP